MKLYASIGFFLMYQVFSLFSQKPAIRIDFEIKGLSNAYVVLGMEYFDRQIILDTIRLNDKGEGVYESRSRLQPGIYVVTFPNQKYFQLLIEGEQFFSVFTDTLNFFKSLTIIGAEQSTLFLRYQQLISGMESSSKSTISHQSWIANQHQLQIFKDSVLGSMKGSLLEAYIRLHDLTLYSPIRPKELTPATFIQQQQIKEKDFIRNFPFNDVRLLRSRLMFEQLSYFFNVFISQHPDSLIARMDTFLNQCYANTQMYKYLLAFFNQNYRHCRTPAYEKVYIHLAENYYLNGKAPWSDARFLEMLRKKVDQIKRSIIGSKVDNLIFFLQDEKSIQLYDFSVENTILFFWDPNCDLCRQAFNNLTQKTQRHQSSKILVIAIYVHSNKLPWIEFLRKNVNPFVNVYDPFKKSNFMQIFQIQKVPYFYLLNSNKTIEAKGNTIESVWKYIRK